MNKKLIKQLEGVGFVKAKTTLNLKVKGGFICDFFMRNRMLIIYNSEKVSKKYVYCTFEGILLLIKEHTGVDLAKKTKREEIEELKTEIKRLESDYDRLFDLYDKLAKDLRTVKDGHGIALEGLGEHLNSLNTRTGVLDDAIKSQNGAIEQNKKEAHMANDRLTLVVKDLRRLGVWKDEEPNKQASEMQAEEKKGFSAGDRVCVTDDYEDARKGSVGVIDFPTFGTFYSDNEYYIGFHGMATWVHEDNLEHAPAESPKEKVLEFGGWAETLVGKVNIPKGSKVLITLHLDIDNDFYCSTGQSDSHFEYYKPEELKPL